MILKKDIKYMLKHNYNNNKKKEWLEMKLPLFEFELGFEGKSKIISFPMWI
jgi:hypothetical protein